MADLVDLEVNDAPSPDQMRLVAQSAEEVLRQAGILLASGRIADDALAAEIGNAFTALRDELYSPMGRGPNPRIADGLALRLAMHLLDDLDEAEQIPEGLEFIEADVGRLATASTDDEFVAAALAPADDIAEHLAPERLASQSDFDHYAGPREFVVGRLGWIETVEDGVDWLVGNQPPLNVIGGASRLGIAPGALVAGVLSRSLAGIAVGGPVGAVLGAVLGVVLSSLATNARRRRTSQAGG